MSAPSSPPDPAVIEAAFLAVCELPAGATREALLMAVCQGNEELQRRVQALLMASDRDAAFMNEALLPGRSLRSEVGAGQVIGRYVLKDKLGEGGFGTVWHAQQTEPVQRDVALKLIRQDAASQHIIARFESERQALALMQHPHIAAVLDAGTTEDGSPYFVMEWVRGQNLHDYCREQRPSLALRLELFLQICQAVQHAHQKGILHRDLKPSNLLVTSVDGAPTIKVIDFGIAKAMGSDGVGVSPMRLSHTADLTVIGTPQYMSPEQAGSGRDLDTRSDIYSLGIILYELLTGRTPLSPEALRHAAMHEVLRLIREAEPPRPSTQILQDQRAAPDLPVALLSRRLAGDLDWIVLKALEKDRERRFESAAALAADVRAYLDDEPVSASPPSLRYRLWKLARRHRVAFAAALVVTFAVIAALVLTLAAYASEHHAWSAERTARESSERVLDFLTGLLKDQADYVEQGKNPEAVRLALAKSIGRLNKLESDPIAARRVASLMAVTYAALGQESLSIPIARQQVEIMQRAYGIDDMRTLGAMSNLARQLAQNDQEREAVGVFDAAIAGFERIGSSDRLSCHSARVERLRALASGHMLTLAEIAPQIAALQLDQDRLLPSPASQLSFIHFQSELYYLYQDYDHAEPLLRQIVDGPRPSEPSHSLMVQSLTRLAVVLRQRGQTEAAYRRLEKAIALDVAVRGPDYHYLADRYVLLGYAHAEDGHAQPAVTAAREALRIAKVTASKNAYSGAQLSLCEIALKVGLRQEAASAVAEAMGPESKREVRNFTHGSRLVSILAALQNWHDLDLELSRYLAAAQKEVGGRFYPEVCLTYLRAAQALAKAKPDTDAPTMLAVWIKRGLAGAQKRREQLQPDLPSADFSIRDLLPLARLCAERSLLDESRTVAELLITIVGADPAFRVERLAAEEWLKHLANK